MNPWLETAGTGRKEAFMVKPKFFHLQQSESVVARMAATVFSGFVQAGRVTDENEDQLIRKATHIAVKMADYTDRIVKSDEEWMKQD
jgi:hypothetical protein